MHSNATRCLLENEHLHVEIDAALGGAIADLSLSGPGGWRYPVMRRAPARTDWFNDMACYLVAPWSNRIKGGAFGLQGRHVMLHRDWPDGSAIHGAVKNRRWTILDRSPVSARLRCILDGAQGANWPWRCVVEASYVIEGAALRIALAVVNDDHDLMPAGLGIHPFFNRTLWNTQDRVELKAAVSGRYPSRDMFPNGPAAPDAVSASLSDGGSLWGQALDDVFAGFGGEATITWPASGMRLRMTASGECGHLVVYSPRDERGGHVPFFCVEPVTMVNDGFNLRDAGQPGTGVRLLGPGERLSISITLAMEQL